MCLLTGFSGPGLLIVEASIEMEERGSRKKCGYEGEALVCEAEPPVVKGPAQAPHWGHGISQASGSSQFSGPEQCE